MAIHCSNLHWFLVYCIHSTDIFLKAARWYNTQSVFPAIFSLFHIEFYSVKTPCYHPNIHYDFPFLCLSSFCAFCLGFILLSFLNLWLWLLRMNFCLDQISLFSLQSLWLAPENNAYYIPCFPVALNSLTYDIVLHDSDLSLDVSFLLDYKFHCSYPALF